jgi:hypothetical protein
MICKQYGEMRTGTNLVRALRSRNDRILMHILGDKHSPPVDLPSLWQESQSAEAPAQWFVSEATFRAPAATTTRNDARQLELVHTIADEVAGAYAAGALRYLVSIKDPYAWAASIARMHPIRRIEHACHDFNTRYAAWLALPSVEVIRYEDLVNAMPGGAVRPAHWDYSPVELDRRPFDPTFYSERKYLAQLSARIRDVVGSMIDWGMLAPFGYVRE